MRFWKRWLRFLTDEEENEQPANGKQMDYRMERAEAKVVYQYPQGHFRFPLIPDDPSLEAEEKPRRTASAESKLKASRRPPADPMSEAAEKKPFRPSDVPSPIFGYHNDREQRKRMTEQGIMAAMRTAEKAKQRHGSLSVDGRVPSSRFSDFTDPASPQGVSEKTVHSTEEGAAADRQTEKENQADAATVQAVAPAAEKRMNEASEREDELCKAPFTENAAEAKEQSVEPVSEQKGTPKEMSASALTIVEPAAAEMEEEQAHAVLSETASAAEQEDGFRQGGDLLSVARTEENTLDQPDHGGDAQKGMTETPAAGDGTNRQTVFKEEERGPLRSLSLSRENRQTAGHHRSERTRIPYNVMMLKQDRRKLEERAARRPNGDSLPPLSLLAPPEAAAACDEQWIREQCARLDRTFESFHIGAKVVGATQGPTVTQFEVQPDLGVKVSKITSLTDDIKLSLAARDIRIEAPIPGKRTIGIEVPNPSSRTVPLREILDSRAFRERRSPLTVALGLDISGAPVVTDIQKMPHGLIAGATGSGKSVCMNAMLVSMLYKAAPHEVKWLLIDPKMVELAPYNGLPHLLSPVITEAKAAAGALKWAVGEMERRYERFVHAGVRDIEKYNAHLRAQGGEPLLPYIVIVIDELADLMMAAPADVEESICRLAQKARACGIHLLIATQRPSVDVITGLIKANIPTRIAFSVSSQIDSRTILDVNGAERLLGRGDMLFLENGSAKPVRLQGCMISDEEIERVTAYVKAQQEPSYLFSPDEFRQTAAFSEEDDELFDEACRFVIAQGGASTSSLQRHFRIGYNRAARLIEMMEEQGLISEARGSKPRDVLMSEEEWMRWRERGTLQVDGFSPSER